MKKLFSLVILLFLMVPPVHATETMSANLDALSQSELLELYHEIVVRLSEFEVTNEPLTMFSAALTSAGYEYTTSETLFVMVGAVAGKKYHLEGCTAEVYVFDPTGEAYLLAVKDGALMNGLLPGVVFNGNAVLYMQDCDIKDEVVELFRGV